MQFQPIAGLPNGWKVGFQNSPNLHLMYPELPLFETTEKKYLTPAEAARSDKGEELFRYVNRWLELADERYGYAAQSQPDWRAMDKARMAMRVVLEEQGRFKDELLEAEGG